MIGPLDPLRSLMKLPDGKPDSRTLEHFEAVNATLILQLYQCYKLDFDLFSYNLDGLLQ